jgi:hypothetical protein
MDQNDRYPAPYVDPEPGRAFRDLEQAVFGGSWPALTAEGVPEMRAMTAATLTLEAALAGRPIAHEERTVPGIDDEPPLVVSVFGAGARGDARPAIYSIHGGGMVGGSRFGELDLALHALEEVGAVVVSPEYRLAPEHPTRRRTTTATAGCGGWSSTPTTSASTAAGSSSSATARVAGWLPGWCCGRGTRRGPEWPRSS